MRREDTQALELNAQLLSLGYLVPQTNVFGFETEAAIREIQEANHLVKDGIVGPQTQLVLNDLKPRRASSPIEGFWSTPYASQRDNENVPSGTCNVTCLSMVLQFLGAKPKSSAQLEDELFKTLETPEAQAYFKKNFPSLQDYHARNVHGMLGWLAIQRGYNFKYTALDSTFLSQKGPVIISGSFTKSGHICVLLGYTRNQDWIVHDPYGDWNTGYKSRAGALRIYNREDMAKLVRKEVDQIWK